MKIDGVVVLYHPDDNILDNIDSYIHDLNKLYVVDNTPDTDIGDKFKKYKNIEYIPLNSNEGIAYALNVGAKRAIKDKAKYLLTMDQDSKFRDNDFKKMVQMLETIHKNKDIALLMGIDCEKIGVISPFHVTERTKGSVAFVKGIEFLLEVMCSGNLINLDAYQAVGGFKDWMFIDCVDFDYCFNLQRNGYRVIRYNEVKLDHKLGDTKNVSMFGKQAYTDNHSAIRWYYMARNRKYIYDMYYDIFPGYCAALVKLTKKELLKIWLFENDKIAKTKAILQGLKDHKRGVKGKKK